MDESIPVGLVGLTVALGELRDQFSLDEATASLVVADGGRMTVRCSGGRWTIERDGATIVESEALAA